MLASVVAFAVMGACVKDLREHGMGTLEVIVWRTAPGLPVAWLELVRRGLPLRPRRPRTVALRSLLGAVAMATNFWAVRALSLLQHTVIHLMQPVLVATLSPLILGERLRGRAFAALVLALAGSAVVLVPGNFVANDAVWIAGAIAVPLLPGLASVGSTLASALAHITLRQATAPNVDPRLDRGHLADAPETVVFHFTAFATVLCAAAALMAGQLRGIPDTLSFGGGVSRIVGMAGAGLVGQIAMSHAYARADAPSIAIVAYAAIPVGAVLDRVFWGATLGPTMWIGALIMPVAGVLLVRGTTT